jgi:hypothetical protein
VLRSRLKLAEYQIGRFGRSGPDKWKTAGETNLRCDELANDRQSGKAFCSGEFNSNETSFDDFVFLSRAQRPKAAAKIAQDRFQCDSAGKTMTNRGIEQTLPNETGHGVASPSKRPVTRKARSTQTRTRTLGAEFPHQLVFLDNFVRTFQHFNGDSQLHRSETDWSAC